MCIYVFPTIESKNDHWFASGEKSKPISKIQIIFVNIYYELKCQGKKRILRRGIIAIK